MNWGDVGKAVAPLAPALGGLLGGFIPLPGGALAGQAIGTIIARQFGVEPTPQAVSDALKRADADVAIAKLQAAADQVKAEVDGAARIFEAEARLIAGTTESVNTTMRVEVQQENRHWFFTGWRPACGWVFVISAAAFGVLLTYATILALAGDREALTVIAEAWPVYAVYFGALAAMVGVYIVGRSKEKAEVIKTAQTALPKISDRR